MLFFGTEKVVFHFVIAARDIIINRSFNLFLLPRKSLVFVLTSFSHYLKSLISETTDKYKKRANGSDFLDTYKTQINIPQIELRKQGTWSGSGSRSTECPLGSAESPLSSRLKNRRHSAWTRPSNFWPYLFSFWDKTTWVRKITIIFCLPKSYETFHLGHILLSFLIFKSKKNRKNCPNNCKQSNLN